MRAVIDPQGRVWDASDPASFRHFGVHGSAEDLVAHAVQRCACVEVTTGKRYWHVQVQQGPLPNRAVERVVQTLMDGSPDRIVIEQASGAPQPFELMTSIADVVARLGSIHEGYADSPLESSFAACELSLGRLLQGGPASLAGAYRSWLARRGRLSPRAVRSLLDRPVGARWLMARLGPGGEPIAETLPPYISFWGDADLTKLIGRPMAEHPDRRYGEAVARGFQAVARAEAPHLEVVDAVVRPVGLSLHHLRYDRLILPWRADDGTCFVSSISFPRLVRNSARSA